MAVIRHPDSWIDLPQLGTKRAYRPTYSESLSLGPTHRRLLEAPLKPDSVAIDIGIPDSLRREDAAKLYELVYFGQGNVLVLGAGHGLAMAICAQALSDVNRTGSVLGVDHDPRMIAKARANLARYGFESKVELVQAVPGPYCRSLAAEGRRFNVIFVDHSPTYADVLAICGLLPSLASEDGFVLFHDFNDRRNKDLATGGYGVYAGVNDGLPVPPFAFFGVYGCTGLYRHGSPSDSPDTLESKPFLA